MRPTQTAHFVTLAALLVIFSLTTQEVRSQSSQALSQEELNQINQQPIVKPTKNKGEAGKTPSKKPTFEHKEADGTTIKEYKEGGKATEVVVESASGTKYEMSTPNDAASPNIRNNEVNRVPSVRLPF